jgi:hypothetical protein
VGSWFYSRFYIHACDATCGRRCACD